MVITLQNKGLTYFIKATAYINIRDEVVFLIRIDEEGSDGETDEDESTDEGDHPHGHLLGDERTAEHGEAGAEGVAQHAAHTHARYIVDT